MAKGQKGLAGKKLDVSALMELIPNEEMEQLILELEVDKWVKKVKAKPLFKLVLYSLMQDERISLRTMEAHFQDPLFQSLAPEADSKKVTWTAIRDRLMKIDLNFCRRLYEMIYQRTEQLYGAKSLEGYHIKRYDSTMVATFSYLLEGMKVGNTHKGKTQVKLTTELTDDFLIQMHFHSDQAHLGEDIALAEAIGKATHKTNDIVVFDRGLKSRKFFEHMDQEDTLFVGRLHSNARYEVLHPVWEDDHTQDTDQVEFIQDSAVYIHGSGRTVVRTKLRLVQFRLKKDGQLISLITNVWDLPALLIAEIYRSRWDIEVLFRFMKQEMNLSHFVCNDPHAIQVMLYFTMIATMLVLIYKHGNQINSYKKAKVRFFKELFYSTLLEVLEDPLQTLEFKQRLILFIRKLE
ncbi:MAG: IS4 family transposase [Lewinellaceae bacterium]|nr:IS4 family transposase [Lewinellaceae bacterium]